MGVFHIQYSFSLFNLYHHPGRACWNIGMSDQSESYMSILLDHFHPKPSFHCYYTLFCSIRELIYSTPVSNFYNIISQLHLHVGCIPTHSQFISHDLSVSLALPPPFPPLLTILSTALAPHFSSHSAWVFLCPCVLYTTIHRYSPKHPSHRRVSPVSNGILKGPPAYHRLWSSTCSTQYKLIIWLPKSVPLPAFLCVWLRTATHPWGWALEVGWLSSFPFCSSIQPALGRPPKFWILLLSAFHQNYIFKKRKTSDITHSTF